MQCLQLVKCFIVGLRVGAGAKQVDFFRGFTLRAETSNISKFTSVKADRCADTSEGGDVGKRREGAV